MTEVVEEEPQIETTPTALMAIPTPKGCAHLLRMTGATEHSISEISEHCYEFRQAVDFLVTKKFESKVLEI